MRKFLYSSKMLYLLAALLVLVFFLPDIIGPIPALLCGAVVIGVSFYVYNLWCREEQNKDDQNNPAQSEEES